MISRTSTKWSSRIAPWLGVASCLSLGLLVIGSIPLYIFRGGLVLWVKLFCPDLGEILEGQGSLFANDYFERTPPRSNILVTEVFQGRLSYAEVKAIVQERWVNGRDEKGKLLFAKFQQCPVRWWGFTFWKNVGDTFSVENHVIRLFDRNTKVTEGQLQETVEKLLNTRHPKGQSPWDYFVVENYEYPHASPSEKKVGHTALIFRIHHCLADGYSVTRALTEGLGAPPLNRVILAEPQFLQRSFLQRLRYMGSFPFQAVLELSQALSHNFQSSPWKVPDERKHWHQIYTKVDPLPLQLVKDIKNHFGVSFTSVLLSVISAALDKSKKGSGRRSVQFLSTLPLPGRPQQRNFLANKSTGAIFQLPLAPFPQPEARLRAVHQTLEHAKHSVIPHLLQFYLTLGGCHAYPVSRLVLKNKMIGLGLTNFPGVPKTLTLNGKPCVDVGFICGGNGGDAGMVIAVLSHGQHIRIEIATEEGLLSRREAHKFAKFIAEEIQQLFGIISAKI